MAFHTLIYLFKKTSSAGRVAAKEGAPLITVELHLIHDT